MATISAVEFDVHGADSGFEVSEFVFLLFDDDSELEYFLLD